MLRADYLHNFGTHFIIGRTIGSVFNPVVGGPDTVVNLESSVKTKYDGLLLSVEKRLSRRYQFRVAYTLSKAFNYANDDQIPFSNGPLNPNNLQLEYGPTPNDQRHRFTFSGVLELPAGFRLAPSLHWLQACQWIFWYPAAVKEFLNCSATPAADCFTRRGAERIHQSAKRRWGFGGQPLPLVSDNARFNDSFNSFDLRLSKVFKIGERLKIEPIVEAFNLFNVTNVLGFSKSNYSGFSNVLVRDSNDPTSPGFLRSSSFGQPVTTAGGVFGSGGPRAFQFAARVTF